ncbi:MAG: dienelactone hydrolase family protein [Planctomycetes bacterium]|nr:dienelactone hydrolase family protein [Planctomycetota bacterium]
MRRLAAIAPALLLSCAWLSGQTAAATADFQSGGVTVDGQRYGYRLLAPLPQWRHVPQPLVVFLHGAGERGSENERQLAWLPEQLAQPAWRDRQPCWVLCVQCPFGETWADVPWTDVASHAMQPQPTRALRAVSMAMDSVLARPGVDAARVYLVGLSMGGFGAFDLAARQPERFAALLAICGGGDPAMASRLLGLPITVYHGTADDVVPVQRSRVMVAALREAGALVRFHELMGVKHDAWRAAFGNGGALDWLFAQDQRQQARGDSARPPLIPAADAMVLVGGTFQLAPAARCIAAGDALTAARVLLDALASAMPVRPGLVASGPARAGDLVFELDPNLRALYELDVGATMRVRAANADGLLRGAAAAWQALHAAPDLRCPRGRFVRTQPIDSGTVVLGASAAPWSAEHLRQAVRLCWLYGATALAGEGLERLWWLDANGRERLRAEADNHGVRLVGPDAATQAVAAVVFDGRRLAAEGVDVASLLRRPVPANGGALRYVVHVPPAEPPAALDRLRVQLPAAAERIDRAGRSVHVGGFLTRLGQLLRQ